MEEHEFVRRYPRLWHLADGDAWDGIVRHGLLSTRRLVELYRPEDAEALLTRRREKSVTLEHPEHGRAVLRDQDLVDDERLEACLLPGTSVEQWFRLLNGFVFLWAKEKQLGPYREEYLKRGPVTLLTFRSASLVRAHGEFMLVATMATGSTKGGRVAAVARGTETFERLRPFDGKRWTSVQEVVVRDAITNPLRHLESAHRLFPDGTEEALMVDSVPPSVPAGE